MTTERKKVSAEVDGDTDVVADASCKNGSVKVVKKVGCEINEGVAVVPALEDGKIGVSSESLREIDPAGLNVKPIGPVLKAVEAAVIIEFVDADVSSEKLTGEEIALLESIETTYTTGENTKTLCPVVCKVENGVSVLHTYTGGKTGASAEPVPEKVEIV